MSDEARPYGSSAFRYRTAGWPGPLPAGNGPRQKDPYPVGLTGWKGGWPDDDQLAAWVTSHGSRNIALRLPRSVVGLDVDAYKPGAEVTMKAITVAHGKLPRTWVSTSREDRSGIRLFANPDEHSDFSQVIKHPDQGDVIAGELIQFHHRVAIVWPSTHPEGRAYFWVTPEGEKVDDGRVPKPADLPALPPEWADHLRSDCSCFGFDWLKIKVSSPKDPVNDCFEKWHSKLISGTYSRHEAAASGSMALVAFRDRGWPGAAEYLDKIEATFISMATSAGKGARGDKKARDEWKRMLDGAEAKAHTTSIPQWEPPRIRLKTTEAPSDSGTRRLRLSAAATIKPRPVRWHWQDRIPVGEITLTPGLGGVGKSTFHAWAIAHTTRGTLPGTNLGTARPVIICAAEDSWSRSIVPRLIAAGADLDLVYRADVVSDEGNELRLTLPADNENLRAEIEARHVALVSLDPLLSTIDGALDSYKSREVRGALEPLQTLADETDCVILGNAHFNKATGADPLQRITGSAAFAEVCRAALAFARDDETGGYVISQVKNNLGRLDLPNLTYQIEPVVIPTDEGDSEVGRLVFVGETSRNVRDILSFHTDQDRTERDLARTVILATLRAAVTSWKDLAAIIKREGISERTGRRARDELRKGRLIDFTGGGGDPYQWRYIGPEVVQIAGELAKVDNLPFSTASPEEVGQGGGQATALTPLEVVQGGHTLHDSTRARQVGHQSEGCQECGHPSDHLQWCPHANPVETF